MTSPTVTPTVTENPLRLEPVTPDTLIDTMIRTVEPTYRSFKPATRASARRSGAGGGRTERSCGVICGATSELTHLGADVADPNVTN